jgi:hypothetical protein
MSEDILKKVKKLLALAGSCNEHEAKSATEKAQALMLRHNLNMQSLNNISDYLTDEVNTSSRISRESSLIMSILTRHFFVRCFYDNRFVGYTPRGKRKYIKVATLVGTNENVTVAKYVFDFLMQTYKRHWNDYSKVHESKSANARNSYMLGLTEGIKETLRASESKVCTEMGLVVVPDAKLSQWMNSKFKLKSRAVGHLSADGKAIAAGKEHGKKITISRALDNDSSSSGRLLN